jgi:hypothetical protein
MSTENLQRKDLRIDGAKPRPSQVNPESETGSESTTCEGCQALTARVEQLEEVVAQRLLERGSASSFQVEPLNTTACYWICVVSHAVVVFLTSVNMMFAPFAFPVILAPFATLSICHVLSTRPVHLRVLRTLLSASVVASISLAGLSYADAGEPLELLPFLLFYGTPTFLSGWFVAKLFVWISGWRFFAPGHSETMPKLQIRHLLACTLGIAVMLGIGKSLQIDLTSDVGLDSLPTLFFACLPVMLCTATGCFMLRTILTQSGGRMILELFAIALVTTATAFLGTTFTFVLFGQADFESILGLSVYGVPLLLGIGLSAGGTFAMLRAAGYRFTSTKLQGLRSKLQTPTDLIPKVASRPSEEVATSIT